MFKNPLKVIAAPALPKAEELVRAKFDRLWSVDPEQFNPKRNCLERERLQRTFALLPSSLEKMKAADLGSGSGVMSRRLRDLGAVVDAVDIAKTPLEALQGEKNIRPLCEYVPKTSLEDDHYDLLLCTDLIAHLPENEYRLLFSELARILKPTGTLVCSSPLDFHSDDALQRFAALAESEFVIEEWKFSYHLLYIRLKDFFEAPIRFACAKRDPEYRKRQLDLRKGLSRKWFRLNSHPLPGLFWGGASWVLQPVARGIRQSRSLLIALENLSRFFWSDAGITHAIFRAKRRTLENIPEDERPIERKQKKQIWE